MFSKLIAHDKLDWSCINFCVHATMPMLMVMVMIWFSISCCLLGG
jgi:hypothetical protein